MCWDLVFLEVFWCFIVDGVDFIIILLWWYVIDLGDEVFVLNFDFEKVFFESVILV